MNNTEKRELFQIGLKSFQESKNGTTKIKNDMIILYETLFGNNIDVSTYVETEIELIEKSIIASNNEIDLLSKEMNKFELIGENNKFSYIIKDEIDRRKERIESEIKRKENYLKIVELYKFALSILEEGSLEKIANAFESKLEQVMTQDEWKDFCHSLRTDLRKLLDSLEMDDKLKKVYNAVGKNDRGISNKSMKYLSEHFDLPYCLKVKNSLYTIERIIEDKSIK